MNRRRIFNICLTVVITAAFILLGAFVFGDSYLRFGETAKDFGLSVGYYFCTLFGIEHNIVPSRRGLFFGDGLGDPAPVGL